MLSGTIFHEMLAHLKNGPDPLDELFRSFDLSSCDTILSYVHFYLFVPTS